MKVAYTTHYDAKDISRWSGLGYYIAKSLSNQGLALDYVGPLKEDLLSQTLIKAKNFIYKLQGQRYIKHSDPSTLKNYARQTRQKLSQLGADFVVSPSLKPITYLNCKQPIAFWTDATFDRMLEFYPAFKNLCQETIRNGHTMEKRALQNATLAIYASDWAASSAIESYGANPDKVKVVPLGANLDHKKTLADIEELVKCRPSNHCNLLFIGVDWFRKGGDVALNVTKGLNKLGLPTTLTIVGCQPISNEPLPSFVKPLGFIKKSSLAGRRRLESLIAESHFLIMPSRAECYGIVFCEANSFGVPCLSTTVGGIPTIIKNGVNGQLFQTSSNVEDYCQYVLGLFSDYKSYKTLATSSFNEYQSRLNWNVAAKAVKQLLKEI